MNQHSDELDIERWAKPFYFSFLQAPPLRPSRSAYKGTNDEWFGLLRLRVEEVSPEVVSDLLRDVNWRTRLCGAWFCGVKKWDDFSPLIAHLLLEKQLIWQAQGFAFALARFNNPASSLVLRAYMEQAVTPENSFPYEDVKAVLGALFFLDEQLGRDDASDYSERWRTHLISVRTADAIKWAQQLPQFWHEAPGSSYLGRRSADEISAEVEQLNKKPLPDFVLNCVEEARVYFQNLMNNVIELGF